MHGNLIGTAVIAGLALAASNASAVNYEPGFDGTWIGVLNIIEPEIYNPMPLPPETGSSRTIELAIEIDGTDARVFYNDEKGWKEVKSGAFTTVIHKTNAVVAAIDSNIARDSSIGWVETWNLTLTHKDDGSLYAYWVRAVNNYNVAAMTDPNARFFFSGFGELTLSPSISGPGRFSVSENKRNEHCLPLDTYCGAGAPVNLPPHR